MFYNKIFEEYMQTLDIAFSIDTLKPCISEVSKFYILDLDDNLAATKETNTYKLVQS